MATNVLRIAVSKFFEYDTPRIVHIRSKKVGIINRFIQLVIISYIIGYVIVYQKGYQEFGDVQSAVTTKIKGIVFTNDSQNGQRTWDVADYVIPPQEPNAFFVMTNVKPTLNQTQKTCPESLSLQAALCNSDDDCKKQRGKILPKGNGPIIERCIPSDFPGYEHKNVCAIYGWCPVENNVTVNEDAFLASANFTVFIKNDIEFPKFQVKRRNLPGKETHLPANFSDWNDYLSNCVYNADHPIDKYCPIFRLETIVNGAGAAFKDVYSQGAVIQIIIDWTCDFDYSEANCMPKYTFRRLDKSDDSISAGFNFRYADHFAIMENNTIPVQYRNLYKVSGMRFLITVEGQAGKFGPVPLLLNVGSGLALLGIATILCDIFVLYILKARAFYKEKKYLDVKGQDAFEVFENEPDSQNERSNVKKRHKNVFMNNPTEVHGSDA